VAAKVLVVELAVQLVLHKLVILPQRLVVVVQVVDKVVKVAVEPAVQAVLTLVLRPAQAVVAQHQRL
jgi:hypothetical protein